MKLSFPDQVNPSIPVVLLLILAIFDSIFTDYGLRNGHITEANPLMRVVYESNLYAFYFIKIILPLLLMCIITKLKPRKYLQLMIGFALLLYTLVLFQHIFWLTLLI